MRTPHLPPKYAAFDVPLWFNKLDMKSFLKEAYNVETIHIRSTVIQGKVKRRPGGNPKSQGPLYREPSTKKMTVELVEPFTWPEEVTDFSE
jgi:large subunit ribosomal protein L23